MKLLICVQHGRCTSSDVGVSLSSRVFVNCVHIIVVRPDTLDGVTARARLFL